MGASANHIFVLARVWFFPSFEDRTIHLDMHGALQHGFVIFTKELYSMANKTMQNQLTIQNWSFLTSILKRHSKLWQNLWWWSIKWPNFLQYRLRYCTQPLAYPRSGYAPSASYFRSRGCTTYCAFPQVGTGTKIIIKYPLAEMQYFDCVSASGTADFGSYSRKGGGCKFLRASPLAGTVNRNNYKISARGNTIFWLHIR